MEEIWNHRAHAALTRNICIYLQNEYWRLKKKGNQKDQKVKATGRELLKRDT